MIKAPQPPSPEQWFYLPEHYSVTPQSPKRHVIANGTVRETQWFAAYDSDLNLVARFRSWTQQAQKPPYQQQMGWEKFSPEGQLIDREVRLQRLSQHEYLH